MAYMANIDPLLASPATMQLCDRWEELTEKYSGYRSEARRAAEERKRAEEQAAQQAEEAATESTPLVEAPSGGDSCRAVGENLSCNCCMLLQIPILLFLTIFLLYVSMFDRTGMFSLTAAWSYVDNEVSHYLQPLIHLRAWTEVILAVITAALLIVVVWQVGAWGPPLQQLSTAVVGELYRDVLRELVLDDSEGDTDPRGNPPERWGDWSARDVIVFLLSSHLNLRFLWQYYGFSYQLLDCKSPQYDTCNYASSIASCYWWLGMLGLGYSAKAPPAMWMVSANDIFSSLWAEVCGTYFGWGRIPGWVKFSVVWLAFLLWFNVLWLVQNKRCGWLGDELAFNAVFLDVLVYDRFMAWGCHEKFSKIFTMLVYLALAVYHCYHLSEVPTDCSVREQVPWFFFFMGIVKIGHLVGLQILTPPADSVPPVCGDAECKVEEQEEQERPDEDEEEPDMKRACYITRMLLLKRAKKEHLILLLKDFGVPTQGSKGELSTRLAEHLHYETDQTTPPLPPRHPTVGEAEGATAGLAQRNRSTRYKTVKRLTLLCHGGAWLWGVWLLLELDSHNKERIGNETAIDDTCGPSPHGFDLGRWVRYSIMWEWLCMIVGVIRRQFWASVAEWDNDDSQVHVARRGFKGHIESMKNLGLKEENIDIAMIQLSPGLPVKKSPKAQVRFDPGGGSSGPTVSGLESSLHSRPRSGTSLRSSLRSSLPSLP